MSIAQRCEEALASMHKLASQLKEYTDKEKVDEGKASEMAELVDSLKRKNQTLSRIVQENRRNFTNQIGTLEKNNELLTEENKKLTVDMHALMKQHESDKTSLVAKHKQEMGALKNKFDSVYTMYSKITTTHVKLNVHEEVVKERDALKQENEELKGKFENAKKAFLIEVQWSKRDKGKLENVKKELQELKEKYTTAENEIVKLNSKLDKYRSHFLDKFRSLRSQFHSHYIGQLQKRLMLTMLSWYKYHQKILFRFGLTDKVSLSSSMELFVQNVRENSGKCLTMEGASNNDGLIQSRLAEHVEYIYPQLTDVQRSMCNPLFQSLGIQVNIAEKPVEQPVGNSSLGSSEKPVGDIAEKPAEGLVGNSSEGTNKRHDELTIQADDENSGDVHNVDTPTKQFSVKTLKTFSVEHLKALKEKYSDLIKTRQNELAQPVSSSSRKRSHRAVFCPLTEEWREGICRIDTELKRRGFVESTEVRVGTMQDEGKHLDHLDQLEKVLRANRKSKSKKVKC